MSNLLSGLLGQLGGFTNNANMQQNIYYNQQMAQQQQQNALMANYAQQFQQQIQQGLQYSEDQKNFRVRDYIHEVEKAIAVYAVHKRPDALKHYFVALDNLCTILAEYPNE